MSVRERDNKLCGGIIFPQINVINMIFKYNWVNVPTQLPTSSRAHTNKDIKWHRSNKKTDRTDSYSTSHLRRNLSHFLFSAIFFSHFCLLQAYWSLPFSPFLLEPQRRPIPYTLAPRTHKQTRTFSIVPFPPSSLLPPASPPPWETQCSVTVVVLPGSCGGDSGSSAQRLE